MRCVCLAVLLLLAAPAVSEADLVSCVQSCLSGGSDTTPATPSTPSTPPAPTTKVFPDTITFDNTSDQGTGAYYGTACVLFPTAWEGKITTVTVNGETAAKGVSYKGRPVFRLLKTGDQYSRPLQFLVTATDGQVYTATSGAAASPTTGGKSETSKTSAWANGNREHFRLSKPGSAYGNGITLEFSNGLRRTVTAGAKRQEWSDGTLWKPVSDSNGNAVVLGPRNVHIASVTVRY